ncbi:MAG: hypothetical protein SGJ01_09290 [Gemmatimonadota bacterium]|nr:hypothetical protein [Gemmatimonadota bacterium]
MTDDELDPNLTKIARAYHQPPEPPREQLWARIAEARKTPVTPLRSPWRRALPFLIPAAAAAGILLAFALGRMSVRPAPIIAGRSGVTVHGPAETPAPTLAQRITTGDHLGRVEVFLTGFRAEARSGRSDTVAPEEARRLLAATRILLDSPGGRDARIQPLLEDLELVLAEIAQLPAEAGQDLNLITTGLDRRGTIARLRSVVPTGDAPVLQGES